MLQIAGMFAMIHAARRFALNAVDRGATGHGQSAGRQK